MSKILLVCYGGAHVNIMIPIYRRLMLLGHAVTVLGLTTAADRLRKENIPFKRVCDYVVLNDTRRKLALEIIANHHSEGKGILLEESLGYLGISYECLIKEVGYPKARRWYLQYGLNAFCPIDFMRRIIHIENPDLVVATNSPRMEWAAMRAANQLNIQSLSVVDLFGKIEFPWVSRLDGAMHLAVFSQKQKVLYADAGRSHKNIYVVGNPAFDYLSEIDIKKRDRVRLQNGIEENEKILLWIDQPEPLEKDLPRRIRFHLQSLCLKHENWKLIVRFHPSSDSDRTIPKGALESSRNELLSEALMKADVVMTMTSTVGMEALLLDIPTIIFAKSHYQSTVDYSEDQGAIVIEEFDDFETAIHSALCKESQILNSIKRQSLPKVSDATGTLVNVIAELL